ncbi:MAG: PQQ-binding-like beta-propeller repeat protein [Planctomycetota bacterium]
MTCDDVIDALELFVLGGLPEGRRRQVEAHLRGCPTCRAAEREVRLLVGTVRLGAGPQAPRPGFAEAVRAEVRGAMGTEHRRRHLRRGALAVASVAAAVLVALLAGRLGREEAEAPPQVVSASERWHYVSARDIPASPADGVVVRNHTLYLLRGDAGESRVAAVSVDTGATRWESACESVGYLAADSRRLYCLVPGRAGLLTLTALDAADGAELWQYEQPKAHRLRGPSRPVPLGGERVCWSAGGALHVLDAGSGRVLWSRRVGEGRPLSAAVTSEGRLYAVSGSAVRCFLARNGEPLWHHRFDEARGSGRPLLALDGGRAYVARMRRGPEADLFCIDLASRSLVWQRRVPGARCLVATTDAVCLRGGAIAAFDPATGQPLWSHPASGCGPLTLEDGLLHFVDSSASGRLEALDPLTGRRVWELPGVHSCDAFARVGDTGYIKTRDGIVRALALSSCARF